MAKLSSLLRRIPAVKIRRIRAFKKAKAWLRGMTGPSKRDMAREAERIARLRTNAALEARQLMRKATEDIVEFRKLKAQPGQDTKTEQAYEEFVEQKRDELERKVAEIVEAVNRRHNRRALNLAMANALRIAGFKDQAEARQVFRLLEPIAEPRIKIGARPITARAINEGLVNLLGAKRTEKLLKALNYSAQKFRRIRKLAEEIEQRNQKNRLDAKRLSDALKNELKKRGEGKEGE